MLSSNAFTERLLFSLSGGGKEGKRERGGECGWLWVEQATDGRIQTFVIWRDSGGIETRQRRRKTAKC